jgi:aminopeptidase N
VRHHYLSIPFLLIGFSAWSAPQFLIQSHAPERAQERALRGKERMMVDRIPHLLPQKRPARLPDWKPLPDPKTDFDAIHYRVALDFPARSLTTPEFEGKVELTFRPLSKEFHVLRLDSSGLQIQKVTLLNTFETLRFEQHEEQVWIDLNRNYQTKDRLTVAIDYRWSSDQGVYFLARDGRSDVEVIYSQSEPEESKYWFPSNSHPNDRATFESLIRIPKPFVALSNGALLDRQDDGESTIFHWSQQIPMVSYLFVVTAGNYSIHKERWNEIPVEYYGYPEEMRNLVTSLQKTPNYLTTISSLTGFRYPYEKYSQIVVPKYMWSGMEHTTATTLMDRTVHPPEVDAEFSSEPLVAHEMAHQWFGDLMTCRNWNHLWLNEGFATYFEALVAERHKGRAELYKSLAEGADWYFSEEEQDLHPVVFPYYRNSLDDFFDSRAYAKGAWFLHMLRNLVGDEAFFRGLRTYVYRYQQRIVTTDQFRQTMEEISGLDLRGFFEQWLLRPGFPKFKVHWSFNLKARKVELTIEQTQDVSKPGGLAGTVPYFRGPIDIEVDGSRQRIALNGVKTESFSFARENAPRFVAFNAENGWLAQVENDQEIEAWRVQLQESTDLTARIDAARALGTVKTPSESADDLLMRARTLTTCVRNDRVEWVRTHCIESLTALLSDVKEPSQLQDLVFAFVSEWTGDKEWNVRASAATLLGKMRTEQAMPLLRKTIQSDPSQSVVGKAIRSVAALRPAGTYEYLMSQLGRASFLDKIRQTVLVSFRSLKDLRTLETGEEFASERYSDDARAGAFWLLATLGVEFKEQASERARLAIEPGLFTSFASVRVTAANALAMLKNPNAIPSLEKVVRSDPNAGVRTAAQQAIDEIRS